MKNLTLVAKKQKPEAVPLARALKDRFPTYAFRAETHLAQALGWPVPDSDAKACQEADLVVVLGGDGTLIHAARLLAGHAVPVLGINLGSLGFMTEIPQPEALAALEEVLKGRVPVESRMKLECQLWRDDRSIVGDEVLNDVVITKGALARITQQDLSVDGLFVTSYNSDGVIVATPTGSTAYSLSAGGPIVHPALDSVIVSPICSHALTQRPIVLPADRTVAITLSGQGSDMYLTLDGQVGHALQTGDRIEVRRSKSRVLLVRNPRLNYFDVLRQKLHWGER